MEERGSRLQALCELYRYSQRDLALKAGISQMAISKLIHGKSSPRMDTLEALARAFAMTGTELYEILTGRQPVPTEPRLAAFRRPPEYDSAILRSRKGLRLPSQKEEIPEPAAITAADADMAAVGARFRALCEAYGYTAEHLSRWLLEDQVSVHTLRQLEGGHTPSLSLPVAERLAPAFGMALDPFLEILTGTRAIPPAEERHIQYRLDTIAHRLRGLRFMYAHTPTTLAALTEGRLAADDIITIESDLEAITRYDLRTVMDALAPAFGMHPEELLDVLTWRRPPPQPSRKLLQSIISRPSIRHDLKQFSSEPTGAEGELGRLVQALLGFPARPPQVQSPDAVTGSSDLPAEPATDDTVIAAYLENHPDLKARLARLMHEQPDVAHQLLEFLLPADGAGQSTNERTHE